MIAGNKKCTDQKKKKPHRWLKRSTCAYESIKKHFLARFGQRFTRSWFLVIPRFLLWGQVKHLCCFLTKSKNPFQYQPSIWHQSDPEYTSLPEVAHDQTGP